MSELNVWSDEDGERWWADGHHSKEVMIREIERHEVENVGWQQYADAYLARVNAGDVSDRWWCIEDAEYEERVVEVKGWWRILGARLFLGARPITTFEAGTPSEACDRTLPMDFRHPAPDWAEPIS